MEIKYVHPKMAENSLLLEANRPNFEMVKYQILCPQNSVVRQGSFSGQAVFISTRTLPKGVRFRIKILSADRVLHDDVFETL
ncbi:MAG TPA: hypothetical protein PKD90_09270 [Phnomibacter sp.]|nr:hypothetical protein [Phnomibacter sp.]